MKRPIPSCSSPGTVRASRWVAAVSYTHLDVYKRQEQYPVGSRIRLNSMEDPYAPVEPGTMGTLQRIDDAGQFLMKWDNGRTLSLIPGEDSFSLILPEPTMMKLYMPLHADLYTKDDWSDTSEEPEMLTGRALMEYEDSILIALIKNRMSEEAERGIMRWYGREDSVDRKVKSVVFTAEEREGQLWGLSLIHISIPFCQ